jgi:hypothetical protein
MEVIEKNKNERLVILFGLLKYITNPSIPIPAIVSPTESRSKLLKTFI